MAKRSRLGLAVLSCLALFLPFDGLRAGFAAPPPLIPREVLFGNPEIVGVNLSPDGKRLVYLAPYQGVLNLWIRDLDGTEAPRRLTSERERPQNPAGWTPDGRYLISSRDYQGDENTVLTRIDPQTGETIDLTPSRGVKAFLVAADQSSPRDLVVALNDRDPRYHDYYLLDVETGKRRLLYQSNDGQAVSVQWLDGAWHVLIRTRVLDDGGSAYDVRLPGETDWKPFLTLSFEDTISGSGLIGFTRDGRWLYATLSADEDLPSLVRWRRDQLPNCTAACPSELVHRSEAGSLGVAISDVKTGQPLVLEETDLRSRRVTLTTDVDADLAGLNALANGREFSVVDQDQADRQWLVVFYSDVSGPQYWLWDRDRREGRLLFAVQPRLDAYALEPMESLEIKARDGLRLPAYLTRTRLGEKGPQPLVLLVHGGPRARDGWGLNGMHQLLANRGYHVLSVNFRGSTGFGKKHLLAGEGEWYAAMQDDLVDAVQWAVAEGIADPSRLAIMGASYGGYAALAGLTRDPELFAASVAEVGPSNLKTLLASIPPYWEAGRVILERTIGVGRVDLEAISPINHVDRIQKPLLLGHGANDPRVKLRESETIASAMEKRGLPIDFVVFPDEGHGIANPRNSLAMKALIEAFLKQHLGGRAEPFGDALKTSSMEWRLRSLPDS
ncbi:MAG: peptidase S9 [Cyanobium sp. NAT70]|nr:peptidase S9 [Cyanobium sp. NAT70]|tara:strand:- start:4698 stop:6707 length:2010 start_codon:yes stop_codon:yes gene_type:complete